jgi:hypothetical protein
LVLRHWWLRMVLRGFNHPPTPSLKRRGLFIELEILRKSFRQLPCSLSVTDSWLMDQYWYFHQMLALFERNSYFCRQSSISLVERLFRSLRKSELTLIAAFLKIY